MIKREKRRDGEKSGGTNGQKKRDGERETGTDGAEE